MIRVLLVEDHNTFRGALEAVLAIEDGMEVVGQAAHGDDILQLARTIEADVAIVDLDLPGRDGVQVIRELRQQSPRTRCLVLTGIRDERELGRAVQAGAVAVLHKSIDIEDLLEATRAVADGANLLQPHETARWLDALERSRDAGARARWLEGALTRREHDVLQRLAQGGTNQSIAAALTISPQTVQTHVRNILGKLDVSSRLEAVTLAIHLGLVEPPARHDAGPTSSTT